MSSINLRQKILDYVNQNQNSSPIEVATGMGLMQDTVSRAMFQMVEIREMSRYKSLEERGQPFRYEALVTVATKAKRTVHVEVKAKPPKRPAWVSGPTDPNRAPIQRQEGIGSGRSRVYVCASAGML